MNPQKTVTNASIPVKTNSFVITRLPPMNYNQYTKFIPIVKQPAKRNRLFNFLQIQVAPEVFKVRAVYNDNDLAYCPTLLKLPDGNHGVYDLGLMVPSGSTHGPERVKQRVKITINRGETVRPSSDVEDLITNKTTSEKALVATNLLQLIVRQRPNTNCKNARAYFPGGNKERFPIGNGEFEIWRGFFQSVRPSLGKMVLTIDTCIAVIYAGGPLQNLCARFAGVNNMRDLNYKSSDVMFRRLESFLNGVRITYKKGYENAKSGTKTIYGIEPNAGEYTFKDKNDENITIKEYFKFAHGIHIVHPSIIGVRISGRSAPSPIIVPIELCTVIPGQFFKKKLPEELTPQLLRIATLSPQEKMERITEAAQKYRDCEYVRESQMSVDTHPLTVYGKLLDAPTITYGENKRITPEIGAWNVVSKKLHTPKQLKSWAVVNFCPNLLSNRQCQTYVEQLRNCCSKLGMGPTFPDAVEPGQPLAVEKSLNHTMHTAYKATKGIEAPQLLLVILPRQAAGIRRKVKYWGDITYGVLTQCVRVDKFLDKRNNDQYWNNVALKINGRLRGQNWNTNDSPIMKELALERFMIMGADVSHPAPKMNHPSTASLVYSFDSTATSYAALTRFQPPRVECILDLKEMVTIALTKFQSRWKKYPTRLFFYRDGISEGEIENVAKRVEITDIQEAMKELGLENIIKLTYIIVTKRHHAVFFPTSSPTADKRGNCLPGTVIDEDITHPSMHDFYLQSHGSIQGTSRSSHYIVVRDENSQFDMERLQKLSYALCHVYAKATRAVSIPAPIYYAHLVCARGMIHLDPKASTDLTFSEKEFDAKSTSSDPKKKGKPVFELQPWSDAFRGVHGSVEERMYFL